MGEASYVSEISNDQLSMLSKVYRRQRREFEGIDADYASKSFADEQQAIHARFLNEAARTFRGSEELRDVLKSYASSMINALQFAVFERRRDDGKWVVLSTSGCPILETEDLVTLVAIMESVGIDEPSSSHMIFHDDIAAAFIAVTLAAYRSVAFGTNIPERFNGLERGIRHFAGRLALLDAENHDRRQSRAVITQIEAELAIGKLKLDGFAEREIELAASLDAAERRVGENEAIQNQMNKRVDGFELQIDNAIKAAAEKGKLASANSHWKSAYIAASWAFWISSVGLAVTLIGVPVICGIYWREIISVFAEIQSQLMSSQMSHEPNGPIGAVGELTVALSKLLIITVPIGMLIWMLRLIVRFNTRSLLLMDDAKQRKTMLETYIFMIEQDAATKQDRGALLEALFRPVPGHGGHNVEAPNFTELLRYGQENPSK